MDNLSSNLDYTLSFAYTYQGTVGYLVNASLPALPISLEQNLMNDLIPLHEFLELGPNIPIFANLHVNQLSKHPIIPHTKK